MLPGGVELWSMDAERTRRAFDLLLFPVHALQVGGLLVLIGAAVSQSMPLVTAGCAKRRVSISWNASGVVHPVVHHPELRAVAHIHFQLHRDCLHHGLVFRACLRGSVCEARPWPSHVHRLLRAGGCPIPRVPTSDVVPHVPPLLEQVE